MATVVLPESVGHTADESLNVRDRLLFEHGIEVQLHFFRDRLHARISAQLYNTMDDIERLAGGGFADGRACRTPATRLYDRFPSTLSISAPWELEAIDWLVRVRSTGDPGQHRPLLAVIRRGGLLRFSRSPVRTDRHRQSSSVSLLTTDVGSQVFTPRQPAAGDASAGAGHLSRRPSNNPGRPHRPPTTLRHLTPPPTTSNQGPPSTRASCARSHRAHAPSRSA